MRKIFSIILSCIMLFSVIPASANSEESAQEAYVINIQFRQIMTVPNNTTDDELNSLIEIGNLTGWEYNAIENVFERFTTYEGLSVEPKNPSIVAAPNYTDENGDVIVAMPNELENIELIVSDPSTDLAFDTMADVSKEELIVIDLDITSMLTNDSYMSNRPEIVLFASSTNPYWDDGEVGVPGKRLHCNRFNGPYGNNTYYSSHIKPQAIANFFYSDCDVSINWTLECIKDDIPLMTNFCAAGIPPYESSSKEASCSGVEGRSRYFHYN